MTLFKLVFEHDMVLNPVNPVKARHEPSSLEDFLKPTPTYSQFYLSATDLTEQKFGFNAVSHYPAMFNAFERGLGQAEFVCNDGSRFDSLGEALEYTSIGSAIVVQKGDKQADSFADLEHAESFRERLGELTGILDRGDQVLFKVRAHHGFDLQLYSKKNMYREFFYVFKPLLSRDFRFFSINGKRMKSERYLYFETWSLASPPHGFEEVFEDTAFY
jgi:hypothetical protein